MAWGELSEEQLALVDVARRFATDVISPVAARYDEASEFPKAEIVSGAELGLTNTTIPADFGGTGLGIFDSCLVIEELARGCSGFATSMVANDLALTPILVGGTEEQKRRFVKPICETRAFASFCLTEPNAGSDAAALQTALTPDGKGFRINGTKQWITNAGYADQFTVFATIDRTKKHKGICCVVVPAATEGVTVGTHENKMGQRASNTCRVVFDNVYVPEECLIGKAGEGFKIAMQTLDYSRPLTAAIAVGIARGALEHALRYSGERKAFGQAIQQFQAIQSMLADMATGVEAARLLTLRSAAMLDRGVKATLESSMAKRFAADSAMEVTTDAVQIYGGYGYTREFPVEKLMRDAKLMQIYEGTSQIQRIVIARELIARGGT